MPERIWTLDLVVALIAWLDYCVRFAEDFDATVVKILEDHRKDRNEEVITFTLLQIDNKLIDLSRTNRVPKDQSNHPKLREVKQRGSKCFPGLKHEIREQVKKYAATWKKRQNQLRVVHKLRRHKDTDLENSEPASSSSCNVSKQSKKDTRMARKDEDCRDINKAQPFDEPLSESISRTTITRAHYENLTICNNCRQITSVEEIGCHGTDFWDRSWERIFEERAANTGHRLEIESQKWDEAIKPVKELLKYIFNQNCEEVRRLKAFHELEMIEVTRQRDHLRQDHVRLTAHNRYLEVAHETRRAAADHDPLEGDLFRQNRIISDLMKRNATLTSDIPYIKEILLDQPKLLFREAKDTTLQIQSELESLAHIYEYQRPTATRITPGSKLEMLLKSVIGEEPDGAYSGKSMDLADWLGHFDVRLVVGHLVLTAVKKQVFYSDFPASGAKNFWWSLLQEHRIIQMDLGGWIQLSSRDKLAYKRIMESEEFEKMLSREATKHSNGLVEILAPLFGLNLGDHGMVEGKSPYTPDNVSKDIHFRFFEIFRAALKFKSSSVITKQRYEFAVHSLECSIQNSHTDTSSVRSRKYSLSPDLWRSASLRIYEAGPRDHLNPLNDALVKLGNFVEFDSLDRRPECLHTSHIMCQMSDQSSKLFNPPIVQRNESQRDVSLSPRSHGEMMKQGMGHECEASQSTLTNESGHTPDMPATELVNKSRFSCGKCPRTFTRADHLERHRALNRCFLCECGAMFQRQKTFERHRNECDCADDTISGSSLAESSVHAAAATQYTSQMEFSQSTSLDNDSRGKYECKRCQKLHDSQRDLKQHMAKNVCSQCGKCYKWSQNEEEHAKHWQECHAVSVNSTSPLGGEGSRNSTQLDSLHEEPQLTISEEIPKPFSRGTADVIIDFALGAPSIEDTAALSPESSALAGNIQMPPTRSMMRSSQGMLSGSTDHKTLTKRERESDECNLVESSSAEESRKRRRLILLSTESPSPDMNPQQTTISVNADIIPDSTISDLELAVARNKSIFGAMRDGIFGHIVSSTVAASSE